MIHNICWTFFHFDLIIDSSKIILTYQNIFEKKDKRKVTDINLANIYTQFLVFLKKNLSIISSNFRKKNKMLRRTNMKIKALKKVQMSSKSFLCFFFWDSDYLWSVYLNKIGHCEKSIPDFPCSLCLLGSSGADEQLSL